ncbi:uncharacterized protein [Rutidosis leptorrhynchoides]|uniref:uncharacterized protein n=1 Tax=Rutidosis leptorrhynchoides TaxID=125765 RepID=UPI003A991F4F
MTQSGCLFYLEVILDKYCPLYQKEKDKKWCKPASTDPIYRKYCQIHTLSRIMRVNEYTADGHLDSRKQLFNKWVLDIGDDNVPAVCKDGEEEATWIEIPEQFIVKSEKPPVDAIVDTIFPNFILRHEDEDYLRQRAILTPQNDDADLINKHMFKKLQGQTMTYKSSDEICNGSTDAIEQQQSYPVE